MFIEFTNKLVNKNFIKYVDASSRMNGDDELIGFSIIVELNNKDYLSEYFDIYEKEKFDKRCQELRSQLLGKY